MKTELLHQLWKWNRNRNAWLTDILEYLEITPEQEDYLHEIDDEFQRLRREGPPSHFEQVSEAIREEPIESRRAMRLRYLHGEKDRLKEKLAGIRVNARSFEGNREFELHLFFEIVGSRRITEELWKIDREMERMKSNKNEDQLLPDQIQTAREYPLWKLLNKKPKERIPCQFHGGKDKNFIVDQKGYCFVCGKRTDAIEWLMKFNDLRFREAVNELSNGL